MSDTLTDAELAELRSELRTVLLCIREARASRAVGAGRVAASPPQEGELVPCPHCENGTATLDAMGMAEPMPIKCKTCGGTGKLNLSGLTARLAETERERDEYAASCKQLGATVVHNVAEREIAERDRDALQRKLDEATADAKHLRKVLSVAASHLSRHAGPGIFDAVNEALATPVPGVGEPPA